MRFSTVRRLGVIGWPIVAGALALAACGSDDESEPSRTTLSLSSGSTAFVVKPPVTTVADAQGVFEDGTTPLEQEYTVQAGDYPLKVAEDFGVPLDDLIAYNGWASAAEFPFPGNTIKIPPGGVADGADTAAADTGDGTEPAAEGEEPVGEEIPEAGDNCAEGEHTVAAGDFPLKLARQYDVTIESLDAANAANPAYTQFVPGQTIIIPAKADC